MLFPLVRWQVWFRVNELLPVGLQKSLPDRQPEANSAEKPEGEAETSGHYLLIKLLCLGLICYFVLNDPCHMLVFLLPFAFKPCF